MSNWPAFDRLARRHLEDGASDEDAAAAVRDALGRFAPEPAEALARVASIRPTLAPERSEAETWAMLDDALGRAFPPPAVPDPPAALEDPDVVYMPLSQLEDVRRELAGEGLAHGYDRIAKRAGCHRSTVVRRYRGRTPPGAAIAGVCDRAPEHQHLAN